MKKSILVGIVILVNAIAWYRVGIDNLIAFYEHLLISVFGAFAFCFALFRMAKNSFEKESKQLNLVRKFDFAAYKEDNWEDWIWTFIFCFPITYYGESVFAATGTYFNIPVYEFYYLGAGPLSVVVGYGLNWLLQKFA